MKFLWDVPNDEEHVTPDKFVRCMARELGVDKFDVKELVLMTFSNSVLKSLIWKTKAKPLKKWIYSDILPLYNGEYGDRKISITSSFVGSPGTIMVLEELIACGAKYFLFIGVASGLKKEAGVGKLILPIEAVREEGTSYHYLPADSPSKPSLEVLKALEESCRELKIHYVKGKIWTTDAIYREMTSKIKSYSKNNVYAVDMETSAIFAVCEYRGIKSGAILVVSDELFHKEWRPAFATKKLDKSLEKAAEIALNACLRLKGHAKFS